jgi:uncharacterized RmlC-like cupin family protein
MPGCVLIRAGETYEGRQGMAYATGVTGTSAGARGLCLTATTVPPGGRSRAHLHRGIESVGYVIDGELVTLFGARLEECVVASAGDFVYIPPDVPHLVANLSDAPARALVAHSAPDDQAGIILLPDLDALAP